MSERSIAMGFRNGIGVYKAGRGLKSCTGESARIVRSPGGRKARRGELPADAGGRKLIIFRLPRVTIFLRCSKTGRLFSLFVDGGSSARWWLATSIRSSDRRLIGFCNRMMSYGLGNKFVRFSLTCTYLKMSRTL